MKNLQQQAQSLEVFEAYKENRLRGGDLSKARGEGQSIIVAYRHNALRFDTVVANVGRTITGAHLITMAVREPEDNKYFYLTLKSRNGVMSWRSLKGTKFEEFGEMPDEAILHEDEELAPDVEANFTPDDERWFKAAYDIHARRQISINGGLFGIPPHQPGKRP